MAIHINSEDYAYKVIKITYGSKEGEPAPSFFKDNGGWFRLYIPRKFIWMRILFFFCTITPWGLVNLFSRLNSSRHFRF